MEELSTIQTGWCDVSQKDGEDVPFLRRKGDGMM